MDRYDSFQDYEDCGQDKYTVKIPHQPLKAFRRDLDVDFDAEEINAARVRRELKSLQERLSDYYCMGREEREKHRLNILQNLNQLDLYWFESDDFDKAMFRFRSAWTNHLVDETIAQMYNAIGENLKDLWSLDYETGERKFYGADWKTTNSSSVTNEEKNGAYRKREPMILGMFQATRCNSKTWMQDIPEFSSRKLWSSFPYSTATMDVKTRIATNMGRDGVDSMSEFVFHALHLLKMELDKLESQTGRKREAHRRLLLEDLRVIKENLKKEGAHQNGLNFLIDHFNRKVVHSLRTSHEYCMQSHNDFQKLSSNIEYICEELMNRLILDNSMPEYEKALLGNELNNFRKDAKAHIQEVDNLHYELRELVKGVNMKKLRGLTKEEYKEKVHSIIDFLEKAEVPLHVFKSVGFDLKRTEKVSAPSVHDEPVRTGVEEKDYESD